MENIVLTTPTDYHITKLTLDVESSLITINLMSNTGRLQQFGYSGEEARALMAAMNKMDFRTISIQKRFLQQLNTDGKLVGTITGVPD